MAVTQRAPRKATRKAPIKPPEVPKATAPKAPTASYMRGEGSPFFVGWRPALRDARQDIGQGYITAAARAIDAAQNSGWISGAIDAAIAQVCGAGLRLNAKPDAEALGWTQDQANEWGKVVERRWEAWATDPVECDLGGRMNLAQLQSAAMRQYFATGEIVFTLPYRRRYGSPVGTKFVLMPSHRLDPSSYAYGNIVQGVKLDNDGFPVGYRFRLRQPDNGTGVERWVDMPARDRYGRAVVGHVFDPQAGAVRGITPLAPALRVLRQFDQLADATLTATLLQTIFAATLESSAPTEQILQAMQTLDENSVGVQPSIDDYFMARAGWYSQTRIDLGQHGKVAHLFPGEQLKFNKAENPSAEYEAFAKFLLREIARCIGVTFEQLTGDYTGATYSSVRMAAADFWQITSYRRQNIVGRVLQTIYEAWLEEQIELGLIPTPAGAGTAWFLVNRAAITNADWRGPPKPQADDTKAANAHKIWRELGVITDEQICAELGQDWEEVYEQRSQEKAVRDRLGIEPQPVVANPNGDPNQITDQGEDDEEETDDNRQQNPATTEDNSNG